MQCISNPTNQDAFDLIDISKFENFNILKFDDIEDVQFNICQICLTAMEFISNDSSYKCPDCGLIKQVVGDLKKKEDNVNSMENLRINPGGGSNHYVNITSDYKRTQKRMIFTLLTKNNYDYNGPKIPKNVLVSAGLEYNAIQQIIIEGNNGTCKKFVRRGDVKDRVIGALIKLECNNVGIPIKNRDIAKFMKLPTQGISKGEDILRALHNEGKIELQLNEKKAEGFTIRYLENLNIITEDEGLGLAISPEEERYKNFILDIVKLSIEKNIGMSSIMSSKIVGAIWILINKLNLNITYKTVEKCCDEIRKSTFKRFSEELLKPEHLFKFIDVFDKYNIPHGITISNFKQRQSIINSIKRRPYSR